MAKKKLTYVSAIEEVEEIIDQIEDGELNVDDLSEKVKRVSYLLKFCNSMLKDTQDDVENLLKEISNKDVSNK